MSNSDSLKKDLEALIKNMLVGDYKSADKIIQRIEQVTDQRVLLQINSLKIHIGKLGIEGELNKAETYLKSSNCVNALASLDNLKKYVSYLTYRFNFENILPVHDQIRKNAIRLLTSADIALLSGEYDKVNNKLYRTKKIISELIEMYRTAYKNYFAISLELANQKL